ncbi:MAG: hypothetical protein PVI21_03680 [Candidatus Woesebacteria bacterium]|jgi:serine/threonine protein kinase
MHRDFAKTAELIRKARQPEDVFGRHKGTPQQQIDAAKSVRRRLLRVVAPDVNDDSAEATEVFKLLDDLWQDFTNKTMPSTVKIRTRLREYTIGPLFAAGDEADLFKCSYNDGAHAKDAVLKVAVDPVSNSLIQAEASALRILHDSTRPSDASFLSYLPRLIETLGYREGANAPVRQANVLAFEMSDGFVSLEEIKSAYPRGIHPKDAAWIWRRLLLTMAYAHSKKVIHGAILPSHILVHPKYHGIALIDWCYSVYEPAKSGQRILAVVEKYRSWYPEQVFAKASPLPGIDLSMAAKCMIWLMGGNPRTGELPKQTSVAEGGAIPQELRGVFKMYTYLATAKRPETQDAWRLGREFENLLVRAWGPRKFRPFDSIYPKIGSVS